MKTREQVSNLINCLTNNEDKRQELWVHYLEGNSIDTLSSHLRHINIEYSNDRVVQQSLWHYMQNPPSPEFFSFLKGFTEFEQSLMIMLTLGLDVEKISAYKGISEARIRQAIACIRYNTSWYEYENMYKMSK